MKNLLIFSSPGIWPMLEYEIDIIQRGIDENYHITYLQCRGGLNSCIANKENATDLFNHFKCISCKSRVKNGLKLITDISRVKILDFPFLDQNILQIEKKLKYEFKKSKLDFQKIKKIVDFDNIDIYDSAISTLMSTLKDSFPDFESHRNLFYNYLLEGIYSFFTFKKILSENSFEKIIIFNGRVSRYRPALRLAQKLNFNVFLSEYPEFDFSTYPLTPRKYSHDFDHRSKILREKADEEGELTREFKIKIGREIIGDSLNQNSNHGNFINPEFVKLQQKNILPPLWEKTKFNIVFFTSSDYEMAGIPEYLNFLPEGSQAASIKKIRKLLSQSDYNITVRVHPKNKDLKAANILYEIEDNGLNILHATSIVDSYALANAADIVITFGSQLSVESAFLGKYVIVLGSNMYSSFNFCKTCYSIQSAIDIIINLKQNIRNDFENQNVRIEEACLHMYARKNDGIASKYLSRDSYTKGIIKISGKESEVLQSTSIQLLTKYLGAPIVLYNLYKSGGFVKIKYLLKELFTKKIIKWHKLMT
jgi:hypothetical protein